VKHGQVLQRRQLRDGREIVEAACPHCSSTHWLLNPSGLVECLTLPGKFAWLDGLGSPA
jgi:hypothetical protein